MKLEGKDLEYFLKCCKEAGIRVKPGTGKVTMNGKEFNLYESLKRGLEEAIAYENGEAEPRMERMEDCDT